MLNRRDFLKSAGALATTSALAEFATAHAAPPAATPARLATSVAAGPSGRAVVSLNKGWRFHEGDIPFPVITGHGATYGNAKAGAANGAAAPSFDDSEWSSVRLPHDFASFQTPDASANVAQGYRKRGIGWYRTLIRLDEADHGKHIELQLDGVATLATVWFNGNEVAHVWSGYSSVYIDLTPFATYGDTLNSLVIRADANAMQGWWYEGAGLYRNTWLVKRPPVHIVTDGVFAHPVQADGQWTIPVEVTLYNIAKTAQPVVVEVALVDPAGNQIGYLSTTAEVGVLAREVVNGSMAVTAPRLWSLEERTLYTVRTRLSQDGKLLDEVTTRCGFRTQRFDAEQGFFLNDRHVKLQGVCIHQDHAGVGVAVPHGVLDYRMRRLKELGVNAIRCSHNAQDRRFYELCDELGFLVMDENRVFNPAPEHMDELNWLVRCHRNHPSIILWSVFNEEPIQGTEQGYEMVRRMTAAVRALDRSRPVTAAMNFGQFEPINVAQAVDVVGFNYQYQSYDAFHKAFPTVPMTSSEDTSAFMTRGEYQTIPEKNIIASYDDDAAQWGTTHRTGWQAVAERPFVAGGFVWTGFDYHGEPTPHEWPSNSSFFGIMDLCGFEKTAFWLHQAQWRHEPVLQLAPHWNWAGREGQPITVMALHNLDEVEVFLNGRSQGRQKGDRYAMNRWKVPYAPGKLSAVGYRAGKVVKRFEVETTGAPVVLKLTPDRAHMAGDGVDAQPVRVEALDARGRHVPLAQHQVTFRIEGGDIIGLGNGNPNDVTSEKGDTRALFNGLAQVIVQTHEGSTAPLKLTASAPGLRSTSLSVDVRRAPAIAYQATSEPVQLIGGWRSSPISDARIDPLLRASGNDMNSWGWINPGSNAKPAERSGFILYATDVKPFARVQKLGGVLELEVTGPCEVFVDGRKIGEKTTLAAGPVRVAFPAGLAQCRLAVLCPLVAGQPHGLNGSVRLGTGPGKP
ncbi:MAG: beta-galactosidase GalA [Gammaproteobacteria bacterium]